MVEFCYDNYIKYSFPTFCSDLIVAVEELGREMDPPFAHGSYFIEIRDKFVAQSFVNKLFFGTACESLFAMACRCDMVYCDSNFATFSTRRVNDTFRTFAENLALKWPGYVLQGQHIVNSTDRLVHMDDLLSLFRSKDIDRYNREKEMFFGKQARYTTGNSQEQMKVVYATYPRSGNSLMRKVFENVTGTATGSD